MPLPESDNIEITQFGMGARARFQYLDSASKRKEPIPYTVSLTPELLEEYYALHLHYGPSIFIAKSSPHKLNDGKQIFVRDIEPSIMQHERPGWRNFFDNAVDMVFQKVQENNQV